MLKNEKIIVGIDESGRGPVIGPLVMCAYAAPENNLAELRSDGVKDSKLLTAAQREKLAVKLRKGIFVERIISAHEITEVMEKRESLNEFEARIAAQLLAELEKKTHFHTVYVDSPDAQPANFTRRIRKYYHNEAVQIISENKADVNHAVVAAASIVAKTTRDAEIEKIKKIVGENFNSGYPADPITKEFIKRRHADPSIQEFLRHRWATMKNLKTKQKALGEFGD